MGPVLIRESAGTQVLTARKFGRSCQASRPSNQLCYSCPIIITVPVCGDVQRNCSPIGMRPWLVDPSNG